jgi:CRP/FNR family transcriptional regulator, cyclic AMP receptor protein
MRQEIKHWHLKNHKLFDHFDDAELDSLCLITAYKKGIKNDVILFSQNDLKRLYTVKEGAIKICHQDQSGKEVITEILTEHDIFGYINLSESENRVLNEYAKVISDSVKICSFEVEKFKMVVQNNPNLSLKYSALIDEKLVSFQQKYSDLIFKDARTRIIEFFKKYAHYHAKQKPNGWEMEMLLTHQEIAEYTATSRQTVTTIINELINDNKITYFGRKIVVITDFTLL